MASVKPLECAVPQHFGGISAQTQVGNRAHVPGIVTTSPPVRIASSTSCAQSTASADRYGPGHEASAQSSFVLACSNTTYCCAEQSVALSSGNYSYCCDDEDALFTAAPLVHLSGPQNPLPLFTSTTSTSTSVSASSTSSTATDTPSGTESGSAASTGGSTAHPVDNNGSSLSTGAKAGIGVGVAAVVIILIAVGLFFVRRSRAKGTTEKLTRLPAGHASELEEDYGSPQRKQRMGELYSSQAVKAWDDKSKVPELSNDSAIFELRGAQRPVELEGKVHR